MRIAKFPPQLARLGRSAFYNLIHVFTGNLFAGIISLASIIWFARFLGPKVMGDYAAIIVGIQILTAFMVPGFNQAVIREPSRQEIAAAATFATIVQSSLIILIGGAIGLWMYWHDVTTFWILFPPIILLLASLILSFWVYIFAAPLEAAMNYQILVKIRIFSLTGSVLAGVSAAKTGCGIYALIIRDLSLTIISLALLRVYSPLPLMLRGWQRGIGSLIDFVKGLWGLNAMEKIVLRIDYALVGILLGKDVLGIYYAVRGLIEGALGYVVSPIQTVIYSFYCRINDVSECVKLLFGKGIFLAAGGTIVAVISAVIVGPSIIFTLLGQSYEDGYRLLPGLVLYAFGITWFENIKVLALSQNRHHSMQVARAVQLSVSVILIFPLVRLFGLLGAGASAGIAAVSMAALSTWLLSPDTVRYPLLSQAGKVLNRR